VYLTSIVTVVVAVISDSKLTNHHTWYVLPVQPICVEMLTEHCTGQSVPSV